MSTPPKLSSLSRRNFVAKLGGAGIAATALTGSILSSFIPKTANAQAIGPLDSQKRRLDAYKIRTDCAKSEKQLDPGTHPTNGDEQFYASKIANFTKGLPHDDFGEVDLNAYGKLLGALASGAAADFDSLTMGGSGKFVNPQSAYTFELEGADSHCIDIPVPPGFSSAWQAGEIAELYWRALTRDVPFDEFETSAIVQKAANDLSSFSDFRGPKSFGKVTPATLFRGNAPGNLTGPFISQFLLKDVPYGPTSIPQFYASNVQDDNHVTTYDEWLRICRGLPPSSANVKDASYGPIETGRDMAFYLHFDFSYQAYLNAALILLSFGKPALKLENPYLSSTTQAGFITFGPFHVLDMVAKVSNMALKACWFQKWLVHRRARPEVIGGRVHNMLSGKKSYPLHREILNSSAMTEVYGRYGTYLLPQAFAEGSPFHPSYPAGHAVISGACATVLKAFFNEDFVVPNPVRGLNGGLVAYQGDPLTIGGELNKLAANISHGRDTAGIHWRSDGEAGMYLGEAIALSLLRDSKPTFTEIFKGFSLKKFDGTSVTI